MVSLEVESEPRDKTIAPSAKIPITTASTMRLELPAFFSELYEVDGVVACMLTDDGLLSITFVVALDPETGTGGTSNFVAVRFVGAFLATFLATFLVVFLADFLAVAFFATFLAADFLATFFTAFLATFFVAT
jgi:hypothetical protein